MRSWLPARKGLYKEHEFDPEKALSFEVRAQEIKDLPELCKAFKDKLSIDPSLVVIQWRSLPGVLDHGAKKLLTDKQPLEFCTELSKMESYEGVCPRPDLVTLALAVMTLSHSNAEAVTSFAMVTDTKTKKRNRMGNECFNAICITKAAFLTKRVTCHTFEVTNKHLEKHNSEMYN